MLKNKSRKICRPKERDIVFAEFRGNGTVIRGDHPAVVLRCIGENALVVPVTENRENSENNKKCPYHVSLEPDRSNGLWKPSAAKCESVQCIPNSGIRRIAGRCSQEDMAQIAHGIKDAMKLDAYLEDGSRS